MGERVIDWSAFQSKPSAAESTSGSSEPFLMDLDIFRAHDADVPAHFPAHNEKEIRERIISAHNDGKSYRWIEKNIGVPRSTANDLVLHPEIRFGEVGRLPYLSNPSDVANFDDLIMQRAAAHEPPKAAEVAELASQVLSRPDHPVNPTANWARDYAHSHRDKYDFNIPKELEPERALADDPSVLLVWHDSIERQVNPSRFPAFLVFNMDELKIDASNRKSAHALTLKGSRAPSQKKDSSDLGEHITLCLLSSPDPETCRLLRHLIILPLANYPKEFGDLLNQFDFTGTPKTGWTNELVFNAWVQSFITQVDKIRIAKNLDPKSPQAAALLYVDADGSRRSPEGLQLLAKNNIVCVSLLAHATTVTQPDDMGLIGSISQKVPSALKSRLKDGSQPWVDLTISQKRRLYIEAFDRAIAETYAVNDRIRKAWAKSSLYPWNRNVFLQGPKLPVVEPIDTSKFDALMANEPGRKMKIHGRVITDEKIYTPLWDEKKRSGKNQSQPDRDRISKSKRRGRTNTSKRKRS